MPAVFRTLSVTTTPVQVVADGSVWSAALLSVETQAIRFRYDGQQPSTTVGHPVSAGGSIAFSNPSSISQLWIVAQTGTASVTVSLE